MKVILHVKGFIVMYHRAIDIVSGADFMLSKKRGVPGTYYGHRVFKRTLTLAPLVGEKGDIPCPLSSSELVTIL